VVLSILFVYRPTDRHPGMQTGRQRDRKGEDEWCIIAALLMGGQK